jgi:hypothetical protein
MRENYISRVQTQYEFTLKNYYLSCIPAIVDLLWHVRYSIYGQLIKTPTNKDT